MGKILVFMFVLVVLSGTVYAQTCDFSPKCVPNVRECGCGGTQTRYTLCDGGCSAWYPCSVADTETDCNDGFDNDCDQLVDCADTDCGQQAYCIDSDSDTFPLSVDCDDSDSGINPVADELCDGLDNNCDGTVDEGCDCIAGQRKECGSGVGECEKGTQLCQPDGTWGECDGIGPSEEICDGLDNNCDGIADEGCDCIDGTRRQCGSDVGVCKKGEEICVNGVWSACEGAVNPVDEICGNSLDDNCDGNVDETCPNDTALSEEQPYALEDLEGEKVTGKKNISYTPLRKISSASPEKKCIDMDGDSFGIDCPAGFDCDDEDAAVFPGAEEICNNKDDNCNSIVDEYLTRRCGTTDTGVCTFGTERCVGGVWTGCDAVFPLEEICGNGLDDDCDGQADDGCTAYGKDELALKQYLNIKYGRGQYDWEHYLESYRRTKMFVSIRKSSVISEDRTKIRLEIIPNRVMKNFTVFEHIPKFVAYSTDNIRFSIQPEVLRDDPLVAWHFAELREKADLSYEVVGEVEDAALKTSTIAFAEDSAPIERPWYFDLIPLMIIPVIGLIFVFLVEIAHKRR